MGNRVWSALWNPPGLAAVAPLGDSSLPAPLPRRWGLLAAILALCIVPRVWMALATHELFPDSIVYLETCRALERGDAQPMLDRFGLNTYAVVLLLLRRTGMDWTVAGEWWSVAMASLAVLPLFGWVRRMFDDRVATVACLLYVVHPRFIYVSPLILRDPTFWLLFNLAIYFLWRAAAEVRPALIALAIATTILMAHTRVEGWLLLLPAGTWMLSARRRLLAGWLRVAAGVVLAGVLLTLCGAAIVLALPSEALTEALAHWRPWDHAAQWLNVLSGHAIWPRLEAAWDQPVERSGVELVVKLLVRCVKAHTYAYMLLALAGLGYGWRAYLRSDQRGLALFTLATLVGLGLQFRRYQIDEMRYFLSMIVVGLPYMALGLMATVGCLARPFQQVGTRGWARPALAGLLSVALIAGTAIQIAGFERPELRQVVLGKWIRENLGPNQRILGSTKHMGLTAYYADGRLIPYPGSTEYDAEPLMRSIGVRNPSVVILWSNFRDPDSDEYDVLLNRYLQVGYAQVEPQRLPELCRDTVVLVRAAHESARRADATQR